MMRFERCINPVCRRPFQVNEFAGRTGEGGPQLVVCPHCGHAESRPRDRIYLVHALSAEQEADFNTTHPLNPEESAENSA